MRYEIYGIGDNGDHALLHECGLESEGRRWAQGYVRHGDHGGWNQIQLVDLEAHASACILRVWSPGEGEREG